MLRTASRAVGLADSRKGVPGSFNVALEWLDTHPRCSLGPAFTPRCSGVCTHESSPPAVWRKLVKRFRQVLEIVCDLHGDGGVEGGWERLVFPEMQGRCDRGGDGEAKNRE